MLGWDLSGPQRARRYYLRPFAQTGIQRTSAVRGISSRGRPGSNRLALRGGRPQDHGASPSCATVRDAAGFNFGWAPA